MALADTAIELLHTSAVVEFHGHKIDGPIKTYTDSKAAYDLCHRFTSAQNSRHVDRKLFKMRELRGAGFTSVSHIAGESNPADILTKILSRQLFERHRRVLLNLPASFATSSADGRRIKWHASSSRDGTDAP